MREDLIRMKKRAQERDARTQLRESMQVGRETDDHALEADDPDAPKTYVVSSPDRLNSGLKIQLRRRLQE